MSHYSYLSIKDSKAFGVNIINCSDTFEIVILEHYTESFFYEVCKYINEIRKCKYWLRN